MRIKNRTKENSKLLPLKVVRVTYERRSLTRGFKFSDSTIKLTEEVVATGGFTVV